MKLKLVHPCAESIWPQYLQLEIIFASDAECVLGSCKAMKQIRLWAQEYCDMMQVAESIQVLRHATWLQPVWQEGMTRVTASTHTAVEGETPLTFDHGSIPSLLAQSAWQIIAL